MDIRHIDTVLSPMLLPLYELQDKTVVVIDVLRATTSICTALANGAEMILPVDSREAAEDMAKRGYIVAGERGGVKLPFAALGNSPLGFTRERVSGEEIVYCSTNGTKTIVAAELADTILIGAFVNLSALTEHIVHELRGGVILLCSGWKGKCNIEDTLCAGAMAEQLLDNEGFAAESDSTNAALDMWKASKNNLLEKARTVEHWKRLEALGEGTGCEQCFAVDALSVVPQFSAGRILPSPVTRG